MKSVPRFFRKRFLLTGGCLLPSLFLFQIGHADTVLLKNGKELKGLVVEEHADRIILSTEKEELPIIRAGITEIQYDDPEQNFMKIGKSYEAEGKYGEALAYYEKALELNPGFEDARKAAMAMRNRFWSMTIEGPRGEMEKKQAIYDSWGSGRPLEAVDKQRSSSQAKDLRERMGLTLEKKGDWVRVAQISPKKDAAIAGLRKGDRLVAIDGESLRYLPEEVVTRKMLEPRYSNFTLEIERESQVVKSSPRDSLADLGLRLRLEYQGLVLDKVKSGSAAQSGGLKEGDLLTEVNGLSTRYMPLGKLSRFVQDLRQDSVVFSIRRPALLARR